METGLRRVCNDVAIGKLLIQTDPSTGEPQVSDIGNDTVCCWYAIAALL